MTKHKIWLKTILIIRNTQRILIRHINTENSSRNYSDDTSKRPGKEERIDTVKMPGFVHPQTMHEEGYFTQKAKQQLEELKKRADKPSTDNPEKKE